ncbi:hypothetical protein FB45DRAFT_206215 [Roridomyces roridus]|uniref:Arrestin C-terminal-like domain-containing protein n=1 Tax=Roridomyces roridus TaxID=1738132 RepID=A0AAD7CFZ9_9AGAR|nr:hypothetical protein FB45DRAFT_206215 [Roridomyces roridus]
MPKNSLSVHLNEGALFLHTSENNARRRGPVESDTRPSMLRGLLTLTLVKPMKITCIDLELQAKTSTSWPEGIGARRIDVQEEHKIFSESIVYFRAGPAPRRTASVGPGVDPWREDEPDTPRHDDLVAHPSRRLSVDSSYFHMSNLDEYTPPIPPYSPLPSPSHPSPAQSSGHVSRFGEDHLREDPAHALEDFRNALRAGLSPARTPTGDRSPAGIRSSSSSFRDVTLSRRPSIDTLAEVAEGTTLVHGTSSPRRDDSRGRRGRFSLSSVSSALMDAVRTGSSRTRSSKEREDPYHPRGRPREKTETPQANGSSKELPVFGRAAGFGLKIEGKEKSDSWKEFKKGTYTFPISFAIPQNSPPTMTCPYGSVVWRLKANVHRPGAFAARMTAAREVMVVAGPQEDDNEETENIVVERHWEQQMQYLISISGRSFPIGGTVPITLTLLPIAKVKIHRLEIYLEEKVEYYSQMKRVARTDPVMRISLLSIKHDIKMGGQILPLESNDPEALTTSPLLGLTMPGDDISELASEWMGPGPWTFHNELEIPSSCSVLHFTNKSKKSNMCVTHLLKCVIRVERGDDTALDPKTGKRKLFDIVVQTPVHILSCRCSPEWMSLPQYSPCFDENPSGIAPSCPCQVKRQDRLRPTLTHHSSDSAASAAETSPVHGGMPSLQGSDTLFARNSLFERLMAGQVSELGEAPPAYAG